MDQYINWFNSGSVRLSDILVDEDKKWNLKKAVDRAEKEYNIIKEETVFEKETVESLRKRCEELKKEYQNMDEEYKKLDSMPVRIKKLNGNYSFEKDIILPASISDTEIMKYHEGFMKHWGDLYNFGLYSAGIAIKPAENGKKIVTFGMASVSLDQITRKFMIVNDFESRIAKMN